MFTTCPQCRETLDYDEQSSYTVMCCPHCGLVFHPPAVRASYRAASRTSLSKPLSGARRFLVFLILGIGGLGLTAGIYFLEMQQDMLRARRGQTLHCPDCAKEFRVQVDADAPDWLEYRCPRCGRHTPLIMLRR